MIASFEEDWIKKFDPQKRLLTGSTYLLAKRVMDLSLVLTTIALWLPLNMAIALIIMLTSPGEPVVFKQLRTGRGGRRFNMYKFRTMVPNAEALKSNYAYLNELQWPDFKITNDPRITPIGRFLRQTSLDELPQLFNVIRGDMNIVGPRPERPKIVAEMRQAIPQYQMRQRVKPGITGWAQVNQAYDFTVDDVKRKIDYDLEYLRKQSLLEDLRIMSMTIPVVLFRRGGW